MYVRTYYTGSYKLSNVNNTDKECLRGGKLSATNFLVSNYNSLLYRHTLLAVICYTEKDVYNYYKQNKNIV